MQTLNERAIEVINMMISEGYDIKQIEDAFNDGEYLTSIGYTDEDQELLEEISDILSGMIG